MKNFILILSFILSASSAMGGNEGGGGGKGFVCPDQNSEAGETLYLADTYELEKLGLFSRIKGHGAMSFKYAAEVINELYPQKLYQHPYLQDKKIEFGTLLSHIRNTIIFQRRGHQRLADYPDDFISMSAVPEGCKKIQIAFQNLDTGVVYLTDGMHRMSTDNWFYLELHETLLALRDRPGYNTTEIRKQVATIAKALSDPRSFSDDVLSRLAIPWLEYPMVAKDYRNRFKTLYRMPKQLVCYTTWRSERSKSAPRFLIPQKLILTRVKGDGRVGRHNVYEINLKYKAMRIPYWSEKFVSEKTEFYTEAYNILGNLDELGTFSWTSHYGLSTKTKMVIDINDYDAVTGEYLGQFDFEYNQPDSAVELDRGYGVVCYPSEAPLFRFDERSKNL